MSELAPGSRVRLIHTEDEYTSIIPGDKGTVTSINSVDIGHREKLAFTQIWIRWDNGELLALIEGKDDFEVLPNPIGIVYAGQTETGESVACLFDRESGNGHVFGPLLSSRNEAIEFRSWLEERWRDAYTQSATVIEQEYDIWKSERDS